MSDRKKRRIISFVFSFIYALIVVVCAMIMQANLIPVYVASQIYQISHKGKLTSQIVNYQIDLFSSDQNVFGSLARFYFLYVVITAVLFDCCKIQRRFACSGNGSLNNYCKLDNFAIMFFGRIILNLILIFFTLIVFDEVSTAKDNMDQADTDWAESTDFNSKVFAPMLICVLSLVFLPFDYYFGFNAISEVK